MAPGLPEQKFGTMWVMVLFRAIIWFILLLISVFGYAAAFGRILLSERGFECVAGRVRLTAWRSDDFANRAAKPQETDLPVYFSTNCYTKRVLRLPALYRRSRVQSV